MDEAHRYHRLKKTLRNLRLALESTPHSNRQAEHICLKTFETTCAGIVALKLTAPIHCQHAAKRPDGGEKTGVNDNLR